MQQATLIRVSEIAEELTTLTAKARAYEATEVDKATQRRIRVLTAKLANLVGMVNKPTSASRR